MFHVLILVGFCCLQDNATPGLMRQVRSLHSHAFFMFLSVACLSDCRQKQYACMHLLRCASAAAYSSAALHLLMHAGLFCW